VKWVKYFLCYLPGAVLRLWVLCSRVALECYLRAAVKSTSLKLPVKVEQMKTFLSSKLNWLKEVIMSSGIFLVELLLLSALVLCVSASCSVPYSHKQSFYRSPTPTGKAEPNCCSVSSPGQQAKTLSRSVADTLRTWGKRPLWESSVFISGHHLGEDK
jgi:hypothetical protein